MVRWWPQITKLQLHVYLFFPLETSKYAFSVFSNILVFTGLELHCPEIMLSKGQNKIMNHFKNKSSLNFHTGWVSIVIFIIYSWLTNVNLLLWCNISADFYLTILNVCCFMSTNEFLIIGLTKKTDICIIAINIYATSSLLWWVM